MRGAELRRHARDQFLLHRHGVLRVTGTHAPATQHAGIDDRRGAKLAEVGRRAGCSCTRSTVPVSGLWAAAFSRSQSTTRSRSLSVQPRVCTLRTTVAPGFVEVYGASFAAYARYFPKLNFTAVLPVPKTSYATPTRGVKSLYASTPGV